MHIKTTRSTPSAIVIVSQHQLLHQAAAPAAAPVVAAPAPAPVAAPAPAPAPAPVAAAPAPAPAPAAEKPKPAEKKEKPAPAPAPAPAAAAAAAEDDADEGGAEGGAVGIEEEFAAAGFTPGKKHVNIVFIGHVDAGKSTISGHVMYLTGQVDDRTLEKFEREAKAKNRESWKFAWAMDTTDQERAKGKTEECGRGTFELENRTYTILDAPGHRNFVPHMIDGASQADIACLVISARKGEFETGFERGGQTREHAVLTKTAGVKTLIVAINKMDDPTVEWSKDRYDECQTKLAPFLRQSGFGPKDVVFMPLSGLSGLNIKERLPSGLAPWYDGPSLLEFLDTFEPPQRLDDQPFRFPIHEKYRDMGTIVVGKVEAGSVRKGEQLIVMPNRTPVEVLQIQIEGADVNQASPGDNVKIKLKGVEEEDLRVGYVICSESKPVQGCRFFDAKVNILEYKSIICSGWQCVMHVHAAVEECTLIHLLALLDKKTGKVAQKKPQFVKQGQTIMARIRLANPVCIEKFKDFQQLGRFVLRDEGRTVGVGVITELHFPKPKADGQGAAAAEAQ